MKEAYSRLVILAVLAIFCGLIISVILYPSLDLVVSGFFYRPSDGFYLATNPFCVALHNLAYYGARILGAIFAILASLAYARQKAFLQINAKGWLFLFIALVIGPVLIANVAFKDHWGRARPREVVAFGGTAPFSAALVPQSVERKNSSFVSGDGAFGFFLPSFAYVVPTPRSRRTFWAGIAGGVLLGSIRIVMGAHFLSDVLFAALFMMISSALVFGAMYDKQTLRQRWRSWLSLQELKQKSG